MRRARPSHMGLVMSETLTISQALRRIKKIKGQLAESRARAANSVTHRFADQPAFSFGTCVEQADTLRKELVEMQARVALANAVTTVVWDERITPLCLATRLLDEYKSEIAWLRGLVVKAQPDVVEEETDYNVVSGKNDRRDVRFKCALPEAKRAAEVARVQDLFDRLNDAVEQANHKTTLQPLRG